MLHSSLTLCISIQQRKRHTRKAISELQLMPGTQSLSLSQLAWQPGSYFALAEILLDTSGEHEKMRWDCSAARAAVGKKNHTATSQHFPYKHTYIHTSMTSSCCWCRALHFFTSYLSLSPPLCLSLCLLVAVSGSTTTIYHISITWLINHATHIFQHKQR